MKFDHADSKVRFAGLTNNDDVEMTSDLMSKYDLDEQPNASLSQVVQQLPPVEIAQLYVENPYDVGGKPLPITGTNATINPDTAIELVKERGTNAEVREGDGDQITYSTHSTGYAAVPHYEFFLPMATAFQNADVRNIAGEFRIYDDGAKVHGDIMFQDPDTQLNLTDDSDPLFVGLSVGNSYDGTVSMYAMGFAMDTFCNNSMRNLTEKKSRKHIGEPDEVPSGGTMCWSRLLHE